MTRLDRVKDSTQSDLNVCKGTLKTLCSRKEQCCSKWEKVLIENHVNRESKSLEITI